MPETTVRVKEIIESYLLILKKKGIPTQKAYLFGSQAKGTAGSYSDIDLIIVSPAFTGMPRWKRWEILGDALSEIMEPIEVIAYAPDEIKVAQNQKTGFLHQILSEPETVEFRI